MALRKRGRPGKRRSAWKGPHWIRTERRVAIYERDEWKCVYCQKIPERYTLDHLVPVARGGSNDTTNLVTACARCNQKRGDQHVAAWIGVLAEDGHDPIAIANRIRMARRSNAIVSTRAKQILEERKRERAARLLIENRRARDSAFIDFMEDAASSDSHAFSDLIEGHEYEQGETP